MLSIIKMNKKQPFEAFEIPEDGNVNLFEISKWLDGSGINMGDIKPGYYIIKDMHVKTSRVSVIDEETLNRFYDIKELPDEEEKVNRFYDASSMRMVYEKGG